MTSHLPRPDRADGTSQTDRTDRIAQAAQAAQTAQTAQAAQTAQTEWTEHVLVRDGVRLSCRDWGGRGDWGGGGGRGGETGPLGPVVPADGTGPAGPPRSLLLLHGLAGQAGEWDALARLLRADGHRVVALDQRGHGASERRPADTSRAAYVADIIAVLDDPELGLACGPGGLPPVLVGQSYGGHAAFLAAAAHSSRLAGAVLVEAGPGPAEPGVPEEIGGWLRAWPVPFPSREAAAAYLGGGPVGDGWAGGLEQRDGGWWPRFDPEVMVASLAENSGRDWWAEWAAIGVPLLSVIGEKGIVEGDEYDGMARLQPGLRGACLPGAGHDLHLERPDVLHELVARFLDELPR
ncbi:alpha/beta hydrolase [Streptomyces sp. NPDC051079]|uniref:alpha/beta fold hydrolase n=1 Tax=Streptomyces sp. NPDC051079 TaxID=3155043 RepID=UPI003450EB1F